MMLLSLLHFSTTPSRACVVPEFGTINATEILEKLPVAMVYRAVGPATAPIFESFETPYQFHLNVYPEVAAYHAVAAYSPDALDIWGRELDRFCTDGHTEEEMTAHKRITHMVAYTYSNQLVIPGDDVAPVLSGAIASLGLAWVWDEVLDITEPCADITTPWGMGVCISHELAEFSKADGWNMDGTIGRTANF